MGANTTTYKRAGAYVTDPVLNETTGQFSANYTPGVSERRADVSTFLHSGLKNADARTTEGSAVTADRQYDAFGNLTGGNGTWNGPFGYAGGFGYQEDGESGLKLLGHRYYDSTTGRFLSKDPIGAGRNWYGYCDNNPLASFDSTGLDKQVASALYKRSPHLGKRYQTDKEFSSEMHRRIGKKKKEEQPHRKGKDKERTNPNLTDEQLGDIAEDLDAERPAKKARDSKMQLHDGDERTPSYRPLPVSPPRPSLNWGAVGMGVLVVGGAVLVGLAVAASGGTLVPVAIAAAAVVVTGTAATRKRPVPGG